MVIRALTATFGVFTLGLALAGPVRADDTGLAQSLHDIGRVGNKLCMLTHEHFGSSSGQPNRKAAEAAAWKSWSEFTAWEYGTDWASPRLAAGVRMSCSQSGGSFGCELYARGCKAASGSSPKKK